MAYWKDLDVRTVEIEISQEVSLLVVVSPSASEGRGEVPYLTLVSS
jgi:hypothetical protein